MCVWSLWDFSSGPQYLCMSLVYPARIERTIQSYSPCLLLCVCVCVRTCTLGDWVSRQCGARSQVHYQKKISPLCLLLKYSWRWWDTIRQTHLTSYLTLNHFSWTVWLWFLGCYNGFFDLRVCLLSLVWVSDFYFILILILKYFVERKCHRIWPGSFTTALPIFWCTLTLWTQRNKTIFFKFYVYKNLIQVRWQFDLGYEIFVIWY